MLVAWCSFLYGWRPNGRWYLPSRASMGPTRRRWTFSRAWPTCCTRRPTAPHLMIVTAQAVLAKRRPAPGGRQRAAGTPSATNRCPIRRPHSAAGPPRTPGPDTRGRPESSPDTPANPLLADECVHMVGPKPSRTPPRASIARSERTPAPPKAEALGQARLGTSAGQATRSQAASRPASSASAHPCLSRSGH